MESLLTPRFLALHGYATGFTLQAPAKRCHAQLDFHVLLVLTLFQLGFVTWYTVAVMKVIPAYLVGIGLISLLSTYSKQPNNYLGPNNHVRTI